MRVGLSTKGEHDCYGQTGEDLQLPAVKAKLARSRLLFRLQLSVNEANQRNDFVSAAWFKCSHIVDTQRGPKFCRRQKCKSVIENAYIFYVY